MADFNINAVARKVSFTGASGVGPYAFSFEILDDDDVAVYFNETVLTKTTDYSVIINANGTGSVTLVVNVGGNVPATPDSDDLVIIVGARDIERTTDFVTAGDLKASALNEQLDALTIMVQQIAEETARSVKAPVFDPTGINMILPKKADRVNAFVAFDANGDISAAVPSDDVTTLAEVATDIKNLADIEDGTIATDAISDTAAIASDVSTVAGIAANVTAVAADQADIGVVATDLSGSDTIGTVAANIADVSSVAAIDTQVSAVAADATDIGTVATDLAGSDTIGTVAGIAANVTTVAGISADVTAVAADATDIGVVSADLAGSDTIGTVAGSIANVNTAATNIASINTCASDIAQIITTANDLNEAVSEIDVVATNIASVQTVGDSIANVNTLAGLDTEITTLSGISADITTVAADGTDIGVVAGLSTDIGTLADIEDGTVATTAISSLAAISTEIQALYAELASIATKVSTTGDTMTGDLILDTNGALTLPVGTEAQRPTPVKGMFRFNDDSDAFEGYDGAAWGAVGGGNTAVVGWENQITVAEDYTMTSGNNMVSAGPITIDTGFTVTVPTGSRWVVV